MTIQRFPVLFVVLLFGLAAPAHACSVPVFRYALERWPADPYEIVVFHRGPLTDEQKATVARLESAAQDKAAPANLEVVTVDLDGQPEPEMTKLWEAQTDAEVPWMVARYPRTLRRDVTVWATRLTAASVAALLQSPLRRKIAQRLLQGETAVWVLLESGHRKKDDAAAALLEQQLRKIPEMLELPKLNKNDPEDRIAQGPNAPELRISFVLFRLSRGDPAETALVQMLRHSEKDLLQFDEEPIAFPIFGRGRADEFALVGAGITEDNIKDGCARLIGPCTCQIKRFSPGTDLLIAADWEQILRKAAIAEESSVPRPAPAAAAVEPTVIDDGPEPIVDARLQKLLLVLLACVVVTVLAAFVFGKR
jgi:hypothetical protein